MNEIKTNPTMLKNLSKLFAELETARTQKKSLSILDDGYAMLYVAITCIVMAYGSVFGFMSILVFYAIWLPKLYYKKTLTLRPTSDVVASLLLPALAVTSTLWSDYRGTSIYNGLEFTSLILCTLIMSKLVSTRAFMRGMILGSTLVLIASLISGRYEGDPFTGDYSLVGLFGSKNQVGLFAEIGIVFSLLHVFIERGRIWISLVPLGICIMSLHLSKSASSVLSLALTFGMIGLIYAITRLPKNIRTFTFVGMAAFLAILLITAISLDLHEELFKSIGKDSTLSGRTVLWEDGFNIGMEKPLFGHGYSAFWVQGNPRAEQLWFDFGILSRVGFHFHNLYIESFVELGAVGLFIISSFLFVIMWRCIYFTLQQGMKIEFVLPLAISVMFLIRSLVEVDLIGTFSIGPVLFFSILPRLSVRESGSATP